MSHKLNAALLYCIAIFMLVSCNGDKAKSESDLSKMNLSGNLASIKETEYKSLENFKNRIGLTRVTNFNRDGNKQIINYLNADGSLSRKTNFIYNENKMLEKEVSTSSEKMPPNEVKYIYDKKGHLVKVNHQNDGAFYTKLKYQYDDKGNKKSELVYNTSNKLDSQASYRYNNKNQLIEEDWLYADGALFYTIKYKYAKSGKKDYEARYRGKDKLFITIKYNDNGDPIKILEYDPNNKSEVKVAVRNVAHEYDYDKSANWIVQKTLEDGKPSSVIIRELKYQK